MEFIHTTSQAVGSGNMEQTAGYTTYESASSLSALQSGIIMSLLYFDIFHYPLTISEIIENCPVEIRDPANVENEIEQILNNGFISRTGDFFHLNGRQSIVPKRLALNDRARAMFPRAKVFSKLISRFPYVEGVLITGSLAKDCMDVDGDVDYLIITTPGRLWLCRGLLTAFKKIFLLNSRKYFCINYYVTTDSLAIPDENIFTATEIIFARPAYDRAVAAKFLNSNPWIYDHYPNKPDPDLSLLNERKTYIPKKILEKLCSGWIGEALDTFFFRLFVWKWKSKFKHLDAHTFDMNFRSQKDVSKHHPNGFQIKVLSEYHKKIKQFESDYHLALPAVAD